jgi:CheY-like chemotaxis protein
MSVEVPANARRQIRSPGDPMNHPRTAHAEQRRRILIVDDDPNMVHVLARTLLDVAQLHFAVRGEDALKKLDQHQPDVMLIDVDMPGLNGYEVMERMRSNPKTRDTQVIMVTSHNDETYRKRAMSLGAVDFFVKPVNRVLIRERVDQLLNPGDMEAIELSLSPHGDFSFKTDQAAAPAAPSAPAVSPRSPQSIRSDAITSELFERMTAILEQTESIRSNARKDKSPLDMHRIGRIEEECAEVVQLLVTLSDASESA